MIKFSQIGPAVLVTAAFIGPGTVITASSAGASFGYALVWALVFSVFATMILQEMAARLGIVTQQGLGENIRQAINQPGAKILAILLVTSALLIGNAAYQGGNISGASLGLSAMIDVEFIGEETQRQIWPILIGLTAFTLLWRGSYAMVEKALMVLVGLMSFAFVATFLITKPDFAALFNHILLPGIPSGATLTVIALIGTTVVPYNLFLHAASASQKWQSTDKLSESRRDLYIAIPVGGLISIAILSTAAAAFFGKQMHLTSAADLAPALAPLFGDYGKLFMALGLFAAGISSAITAPLASAYALTGILNFNSDLHDHRFKLIWLSILITGVIIASSGYKPVSIIWFAQVANGILLPVTCVFLLWMMNTDKLGEYKNTHWQNALGGLVLMVTLLLSGRSLLAAFAMI